MLEKFLRWSTKPGGSLILVAGSTLKMEMVINFYSVKVVIRGLFILGGQFNDFVKTVLKSVMWGRGSKIV